MNEEAIISSPIGALRLVAAQDALVRLDLPNHVTEARTESAIEHPVIRAAAEQLGAYFDGRLRSFDLPLELAGTPFQKEAWEALVHIPFGATRSYADQAKAIGRPSATRAIGAANGRNPIAIIVPCHRVIGANGSLTGYGGGTDTKRWLLDHEARVAGARLL